MTMENFGIKQGYIENPGPVYFLDDVTETRDIVFQPDVYTLAEFLVDLREDPEIPAMVVDVGCGWGNKLATMRERHPSWEFTGIDFDQNITHCQQTYDWGTWLEVNLETVTEFPPADIIICADVIEHLVDPVPLVRALRGRPVVLSTPDRDMVAGYESNGPPINLCHVREWNTYELVHFLQSEGLVIDHFGHTRGSDANWAFGTTIIMAH